MSRPDAEQARQSFLDRLSPAEQARVLRTAEISGPGARDPDWLIAEASAAAVDRIEKVVATLADAPLIVDEKQISAAAAAGVNGALAAVGANAVAKAIGPRIDAAILRFESARNWTTAIWSTMFALAVLAAFALGEYRFVHDTAFSDGYRAAISHSQNTNTHRR